MKKIFEKKKLVVGLIVLAVVVLLYAISTFLTFKTAIDYATKDKYYKDARAYMASAIVVNKNYIYPLTNLFGWDRLITKPFYFLRDKFFEIGYSKFPKDEGEKEFWWYTVKFQEYDDCASHALIKWTTHRNPPKYLDSKKDKFIKDIDDLYKHIDLLANAKITDKTDKLLAKQKLVEFAILARRYQDSNTILKYKFYREAQAKLGLKGIKYIIPLEDTKKYEHVYDTYINLLKYSKAHEKESYDYFFSDPVHWLFGDIMAYKVIDNALMSKLYNNKLECNDKFIKIFTDYHREIREFAFKNENNPKISHRLLSDARTVAINADPILAYKCQNNSYMKDYIQYCLIRSRQLRIDKTAPYNVKTINDIKDEIVSSYKSHEEYYGRLKQLESIGIK